MHPTMTTGTTALLSPGQKALVFMLVGGLVMLGAQWWTAEEHTRRLAEARAPYTALAERADAATTRDDARHLAVDAGRLALALAPRERQPLLFPEPDHGWSLRTALNQLELGAAAASANPGAPRLEAVETGRLRADAASIRAATDARYPPPPVFPALPDVLKILVGAFIGFCLWVSWVCYRGRG